MKAGKRIPGFHGLLVYMCVAAEARRDESPAAAGSGIARFPRTGSPPTLSQDGRAPRQANGESACRGADDACIRNAIDLLPRDKIGGNLPPTLPRHGDRCIRRTPSHPPVAAAGSARETASCRRYGNVNRPPSAGTGFGTRQSNRTPRSPKNGALSARATSSSSSASSTSAT